MWDPISVMVIMWSLNAGLPDGRLNTLQTIHIREDSKQTSIRPDS